MGTMFHVLTGKKTNLREAEHVQGRHERRRGLRPSHQIQEHLQHPVGERLRHGGGHGRRQPCEDAQDPPPVRLERLLGTRG